MMKLEAAHDAGKVRNHQGSNRAALACLRAVRALATQWC
jgi:hypothetical protein